MFQLDQINEDLIKRNLKEEVHYYETKRIY